VYFFITLLETVVFTLLSTMRKPSMSCVFTQTVTDMMTVDETFDQVLDVSNKLPRIKNRTLWYGTADWMRTRSLRALLECFRSAKWESN